MSKKFISICEIRGKKREAIIIEVDYKEILEKWGIKLKSVRTDMKIYGSPDRYLKAFAVQDTKGKLYILEKISILEQIHRENLSAMLQELKQKGLQKIMPYIPNSDGSFVSEVKLRFWQLREFANGEKVDRMTYFRDKWRGEAAGEFLLELFRTAKYTNCSIEIRKISSYLHELYRKTKDLYNTDKIYNYVCGKYIPVEEKIGESICHGDFHPLNIIWGENTINSVIDWEFAGKREMLIDAANMLGCIGSEDPEYIFQGMAESFVETIFSESAFSSKAVYLIDMIIALRYAGWLSLWIRAVDEEMIQREIEYIEYLIENSERYRQYFVAKCGDGD